MIENLKKKIANKNNRSLSFWFVRHAQSESNLLGDSCPIMHETPLTPEGRSEAQKIVSYLIANKIIPSDVYTSPQGRSYETAKIIAKAFNLPIKVKEDLMERKWGDWKDLRWLEASERLEKMTLEERHTFVPPDGESWETMEGRLFTAIEEIAEENTVGENVFIIMHRGGLRAVLPLLAKAGLERHKDFSVATGAISKFVFEKDSFDFVGLVPKDY